MCNKLPAALFLLDCKKEPKATTAFPLPHHTDEEKSQKTKSHAHLAQDQHKKKLGLKIRKSFSFRQVTCTYICSLPLEEPWAQELGKYVILHYKE